jgi:hypothetical protein
MKHPVIIPGSITRIGIPNIILRKNRLNCLMAKYLSATPEALIMPYRNLSTTF